jgi:hypothetical protein
MSIFTHAAIKPLPLYRHFLPRWKTHSLHLCMASHLSHSLLGHSDTSQRKGPQPETPGSMAPLRSTYMLEQCCQFCRIHLHVTNKALQTFFGWWELRGACNWGYGLDDRGIEFRFSSGARDISPPLPDRVWGPPSLLSDRYLGLFRQVWASGWPLTSISCRG